MRNERNILIAFFARYPAFDDSRTPDFKKLIESISNPDFELKDLFPLGLHVSDVDIKDDIPTDPKLNCLLDFKNDTPTNSRNLIEYCVVAESFYADLRKMNFHDFEKIYSDAVLSNNVRRLELGQQADQEEFFNYRAATADFAKWLKHPLWTVEQATALTLNKNPDVVTSQSLERIKRFSPFREEYARIREKIQLAVRARLFEAEMIPAHFMQWASVSLEPLMPEVIAVYGNPNTNQPSSIQSMNSHQKRVENNLLLMFGAVFCSKNGYDPFDHPSPKITKNMVDSVINDLAQLKISHLGEGVIKMRLKDALAEIYEHSQARVKMEGPAGND